MRVVREESGQWLLQTSENHKRGNVRAPVYSSAWETWYRCDEMGDDEKQKAARGIRNKMTLPPLTTSKEGATWRRTQPNSMYLGNKVPLFLGASPAQSGRALHALQCNPQPPPSSSRAPPPVAATSKEVSNEVALKDRKTAKKMSKDQKHAHRVAPDRAAVTCKDRKLVEAMERTWTARSFRWFFKPVEQFEEDE